ncbi:hypothetical protein D5F51_18615 [Yersinia hibernica]|uniref:Uncharacterized protein n=2 Tax=Yersinia hibernica TaxID=2339259 RepID=A0ABX5R3X9_9GAMM|nr:hypothetical protein D5F51_18615 [Yersinia hibernica]
MDQCDCNSLHGSEIALGAKSALALYSQLPDEIKKDVKLTWHVRNFYHAMVKLAEAPGSESKDSARKAVRFLTSALFKKMESCNDTKKQELLDNFCSEYRKQYVYPDIITKLQGIISEDSLQELRDNPAAVEEYLYPEQNHLNNGIIDDLKKQLASSNNKGDKNYKVVQMDSLIKALEAQTQFIADMIPQSNTVNSQVSPPYVHAPRVGFPPHLPEPAPDYGTRQSVSANAASPNIDVGISSENTPSPTIVIHINNVINTGDNKSPPGPVAPDGSVPSTPNYITTATLYVPGTDAVIEPQDNKPQSIPATEEQLETADLANPRFNEVDDSALRSPALVRRAMLDIQRVTQYKRGRSKHQVSQKEDSPARHLSPQGNAFMGLTGAASKAPALQKYSEVPPVTLTRGGQTSNLSGLQTYRQSDSYQLTAKNTSSPELEKDGAENIQEQAVVSITQPKRPPSLNAQGTQFVGLRGNASGFAPLQKYSDTSVTLTRGGQVRDLNRKIDYKMSDLHQVRSQSSPADKPLTNPLETK